MELLTYSTNPCNALNAARVQLWASKEVLAEANRTKNNAMKSRAMRYINKDRAALAKLARAIRAKMPAKKPYRIALAGSVVEFIAYEKAGSYQEAKQAAYEKYGNQFSILSVDRILCAGEVQNNA